MTDGGSGPIYRETTERFRVLRLTVEVRDDGLYVRLGPIHRSFRHVDVDEVDEVRVATYSPGTYGGWHWGLRSSPGGNTAYRLRGDRGVEVTLDDGTKLFVGSRSPADLEAALRRVVEEG